MSGKEGDGSAVLADLKSLSTEKGQQQNVEDACHLLNLVLELKSMRKISCHSCPLSTMDLIESAKRKIAVSVASPRIGRGFNGTSGAVCSKVAALQSPAMVAIC